MLARRSFPWKSCLMLLAGRPSRKRSPATEGLPELQTQNCSMRDSELTMSGTGGTPLSHIRSHGRFLLLYGNRSKPRFLLPSVTMQLLRLGLLVWLTVGFVVFGVHGIELAFTQENALYDYYCY